MCIRFLLGYFVNIYPLYKYKAARNVLVVVGFGDFKINIFWLDNDPQLAAVYQCDKHVVKMILESAQMLSAAHHLHGTEHLSLYKLTHKNHPCTKWVSLSKSNYIWLFNHFCALSSEYTTRYNKQHKTFILLGDILSNPPLLLHDIGLTEAVQAMPDEYKVRNDAVKVYRSYYKSKLKTIEMKWKLGNIPYWIENE